MTAPFTILGIDHIVLRAANPAALERFYLDVLGLSLELRQGRLTQLRAGRTLIDIVPADDAGPAGGSSTSGGANLDTCACASIRSMLPRLHNTWWGTASRAAKKNHAMEPKAAGLRSISTIRKATAWNSKDPWQHHEISGRSQGLHPLR